MQYLLSIDIYVQIEIKKGTTPKGEIEMNLEYVNWTSTETLSSLR